LFNIKKDLLDQIVLYYLLPMPYYPGNTSFNFCFYALVLVSVNPET